MLLSTEIRRAEVVLLLLQFITAVVGIWLLGRTAPAIERILAENVDSITSVREMQHGMIQYSHGLADGRQRFESAFSRADGNITEHDEEEILSQIRNAADAVFAGDETRVAELIMALEELAVVNRASMERAHSSAKNISMAGAWALVSLALITVGVSFVFVRRTNDLIIAPVHHLHEVAISYERGDTLRRCEKFGMPDELRHVAETLNRLLDAQSRRRKADQRREEAAVSGPSDQRVLEVLLEQIPDAAVLLDDEDAPVACTTSTTPRLRRLLEEIRAEGPLPDGLERITLEGVGALVLDHRTPGGRPT